MGATEFCRTPQEPSAARGASTFTKIARPEILDPSRVERDHLYRYRDYPAIIEAGVAALFDELPEECVSWRTSRVDSVVCRVFVAILAAKAKPDDKARITIQFDFGC
jgi:hypothetical protein